jgi:sulfur-oxidizing protein SoxA
MSKDNQVLQNDMTLNPALFSLLEGEKLWSESENKQRSCASCHQSQMRMKGVATRYPQLVNNKLTTLEDRINMCRSRQGLKAFDYESPSLLALSNYIAYQSRGQHIDIRLNARLKAHAQEGERLFNTRMGQINLSCAQCHEERAGGLLGGVTIPQAHPTGYPIYRLEWQSVGSLQRRFRNCMIGVRSEPYAYGAEEFKQLELFLKVRAHGMPLETPGVRP